MLFGTSYIKVTNPGLTQAACAALHVCAAVLIRPLPGVNSRWKCFSSGASSLPHVVCLLICPILCLIQSITACYKPVLFHSLRSFMAHVEYFRTKAFCLNHFVDMLRFLLIWSVVLVLFSLCSFCVMYITEYSCFFILCKKQKQISPMKLNCMGAT